MTGAGQQQRQQAQHTQPRAAQPHGRQQQHRPQQCTPQHEHPGPGQLDTGQRQGIQTAQKRHQPAQLQQQRLQQPAGQPRKDRCQQHHPNGHRRQHQPHPRNGQHIGHRTDQRPGGKEGNRQRREQHRRRPLVSGPVTQGRPPLRHAPLPPPSGPGERIAFFHPPAQRLLRTPDQRQHRTERKPEPRLRHRPRIQRHDGGRCQQHRRHRILAAPSHTQYRSCQQHEAGPLRRHAPPREQRVAEGRQHTRHQHQPLTRNARHPRQPPSARETRQRAMQPQAARRHDHGQQGHMHAGNRHQVAHAGPAEEPPLLGPHGGLIPQRQPRDDAHQGPAPFILSPRRINACLQRLQMLPQHRTHRFDPVHQPRHALLPGGFILQALPLHDPAHGPDALLQHALLGIESVRIHRRHRPAQLHQQPPALARFGPHVIRGRPIRIILRPGLRRAPRQRHLPQPLTARQGCCLIQRPTGLHRKQHPVAKALARRQAADRALHHQRHILQHRVQPCLKRLMDGQRQRGTDHQPHAQRAQPRRQHQQHPQQCPARQPAHGRQPAGELQRTGRHQQAAGQ